MRARAAAALALGLAGCSAFGASQQDALKELEDSVEAYNDAYRWKNYERAALFLPPDVRGAFLAAYEEDDKSLHVEGYQILQANLLGADAAQVTLRVTYMELPSVTLQNRTTVQHWHKVSDRWLMEAEDNPIRPLDAAKKAPEDFGGDAEPDPNLGVEVTDPSGKVIRQEGDTTPPPEAAAPEADAPPQ